MFVSLTHSPAFCTVPPSPSLMLRLTLLHSGDDGSKVVVQQDHVGRLLGYVRASDPHGNTDVSFLQGRGVVHTVTSHSDNRTLHPPSSSAP